MDAPSIPLVAGTLFSAVALGGMIFFAAVFAPLVFRKLPAKTAGGFVRDVIPVYYASAAGLTGLAALCLWSRPEALVLAAVALLFVFARYVLMPRINRARDASLDGDPDEGEVFARLHRVSVMVNLAQMAALLAAVLRLLVG
jgi:uncharacterized protein DUF4149